MSNSGSKVGLSSSRKFVAVSARDLVLCNFGFEYVSFQLDCENQYRNEEVSERTTCDDEDSEALDLGVGEEDEPDVQEDEDVESSEDFEQENANSRLPSDPKKPRDFERLQRFWMQASGEVASRERIHQENGVDLGSFTEESKKRKLFVMSAIKPGMKERLENLYSISSSLKVYMRYDSDKKKYFVSSEEQKQSIELFDIGEQLTRILGKQSNRVHVEEVLERNKNHVATFEFAPNEIKDVYDGIAYQSLLEKWLQT